MAYATSLETFVRQEVRNFDMWVVGTSRVLSDEFLPYAALIAQESLDEADKFMGVSTKYSVPQCTLKTEK